MLILKKTAAWTGTGVLVGTVAWWLLATGLEPLVRGQPLGGTVALMFTEGWFWGGAFGLITALVAAPFYFGAFLAWWKAAERFKKLESSPGVLLGTLVLALPFAVIVSHFFGGPSWVGREAYWREFLHVFPFVLASAWAGLWLPRRMIPGLRPAWPSSNDQVRHGA